MTARHGIGSAIAATCLLLCAAAKAEDKIDRLVQHDLLPPDMINHHGHSDFTEPLGRFLDLLAAGAFDEARSVQPDACAAWAATRQQSAFSGKFWVWKTEISLDTLCASP